ncbi:MAG: GntR family transcriptional regulator [Bacilli bacterium]|jgi:GntR family transcriptional regulator|nr:GntR family transcriptional regulator [Bacilli bacterium]
MIDIDYQSRTPIYVQIVNEIEKCIIHGKLKPEDQMPSIRELASELGINPNTVKKSYSELENKNIIKSISTKGTFITSKIEEIVEEKINTSFGVIQKEIDELKMLGFTLDEIRERIK